MTRRAAFLVFVLLSVFSGRGWAAEPMDATTLDRQIVEVIKDVHNRGADLHNAGDPIGCYRMYQGGLFAIKPLLAHRPDTQKVIDEGIRAAEFRPPLERARALHATFAEVRKQLKTAPAVAPNSLPMPTPLPTNPAVVAPSNLAPPLPSPALPAPGSVPSFPDTSKPGPTIGATSSTLWERLGGQSKIEKAIDECVEVASVDPKVNLSRDGKYKLEGEALAAVKRKFVGYVSSFSEGTVPYTGRSMKDAHRGMNIKPEEWTAFVGHLKKALENQKVAEADLQALLRKVEDFKIDIIGETPK